MANKLTKITITDDRFGREAGVGINGRHFRLPVGQEVEVDEGVMDALRNSGTGFTISDEKDGAGNAVTVAGPDPALTGGPKVVVGETDKDAEADRYELGDVDDDRELGGRSRSANNTAVTDAITAALDRSPAPADRSKSGKGAASRASRTDADGAAADVPGSPAYSHDTGGASAPSPGSRDTIATSSGAIAPAGARPATKRKGK